MQTADLDAFGGKQVTQHPAAREREIHVQFVEPPHDGEIGRGGRPWQIVDAAATDPQFPRLPAHRQRVRTVDHRFALGNSPALPSAPDKKSFTNVSSPILACNVFSPFTAANATFALKAGLWFRRVRFVI